MTVKCAVGLGRSAGEPSSNIFLENMNNENAMKSESMSYLKCSDMSFRDIADINMTK